MTFITSIIDRIKENRQVFINFFYLGISYSTNLILPLFVMPFLVKTVGIEKFGLISVAQAIMTFVNIFVDYGFNLTATREIAISNSNYDKKNYLFSVVFFTKSLLCIISLIVLCFYSFVQYSYSVDYKLLLFSFPLVIGQMLTPQWFFQGLEKLQFVAFVNVFFKILSVVLTFFFINSPEDYIYVNLLQGLGGCLAGVFCTILVFTTFKVKFVPVSIENVKHEIVEGWYIFTANLASTMYISSNIIILKLFASAEIVGYYSIAEKISNSLRQVMGVVTQATYSISCKLANEEHKKLVSFLKQVYIPLTCILFLTCITIFTSAEHIVKIIIGIDNIEVRTYVQLMIIVPFIVFLNCPAYQTLLAYNLTKVCSQVLITGTILNLLFNVVFCYIFSAFGTITSIFITELFITISLYVILNRKYTSYRLL